MREIGILYSKQREGLRRQRPTCRSEADARRDYSRKPDPTNLE